MNVSIIIPTRNRADWLCALLASLEHDPARDVTSEVIVVDDASTDGTAGLLGERFPGVRVVPMDRPLGPSAARNRAAGEAAGDLLLFLDADGEVGEGWIESMHAADDGQTILLGNVVDYHGGRVQSVPRRATFLGKSLRCRPERANTGPSCNLGVPRAVFEALGGFDEELPYYFEDSDLCIRARRAGFGFRFVPEAVFRHHGTERKTGEAIRLQEQHSTYAMLRHYEDDWPRGVTFSLLNGGWMLARCVAWVVRGRWADAGHLAKGWAQGNARYIRPRL